MPSMRIPMVGMKYSDTFSKDAVNAVKKINQLYGPIVKAASLSTGVPYSIIAGFMIVENTALDPTATSYGCSASKAKDFACSYGLMQMQVATAFQTVKDQAPALTPQEKAIVEKYLPGIMKGGGFIGLLINWKKKIYDALMIPEFAIWLGAIHIAQLLKKTRDGAGGYRLDHVIVKYNRGVGNFNKEVVKSGLQNVDTAVLAAKLPVEETRSYITKFVGVDGSVMAAMRNPFIG